MTKDQFQEWVGETFPDNQTRAITEADLRDGLVRMTDYVYETNSSTYIEEKISEVQQLKAAIDESVGNAAEVNQQAEIVLLQTQNYALSANASKVAAEIAATNAHLDFIPLGKWNAATNTPALTTDASLVPAGHGYEVSDPGTQSITGESVAFKKTDKVISDGSGWFLRETSDEALQISRYQNTELDELNYLTKGVVKCDLPLPLSNTRFLPTGGSDPDHISIQTKFNNRTYSVTGYTDAATDGVTTWFDTQINTLLDYERIVISATVSGLVSANPCIGIGFESAAGKIGFLHRKDGSRVVVTTSSASTPAAANAAYAYGAGDVITIEVINRSGVLTFTVSKNGVYAPEIPIAQAPTGNIFITMRGSLSFAYTLSAVKTAVIPKEIQDAEQAAKDHADAQNAILNGKIEGFKEQVSIVTESFMGRTAPVEGVGSGSVRLRLDTNTIPAFTGIAKVGSLQKWCSVAGPGKVGFYTKHADGTHFVLQQQVSYDFVVGNNTLPAALFDAIELQAGWYIGFAAEGATQFSDVVGAANSSYLVTGDIATNAFSLSSYSLQYRLDIVTSVDLKTQTAENTGKITLNGAAAFYVSDSSGSDLNNGFSEATSFKTISKALTASAGKARVNIIVGGGDYYETLDFSAVVAGRVDITAKHKGLVRIMGSTKLTGWVKTAGYTNIYEAPFAGVVPAWSHPPGVLPSIFEDKNPSAQILASQVHALQKGLTHRLPYTPLIQQAAGADLNATLLAMDGAAGRHYLSGGKMYVHASNSTNPGANGFDYHVPVRASNAVPNSGSLSARAHIFLENLQFCFSTSGFISSSFASVGRINCSSLGIVDSWGGWRDDSAHVVSYKDEVGGSSNDGFNQHYDTNNPDYALQDVRRGIGIAFYFDPWAHDCGDDGMSCHPRSEVTVYGGLAEYNGDGGFVPANGGTYRIYNAISRYNQQKSDATQAGFGTANTAAGTGRNQTTLLCFGCISEGDKIAFQNNSEAGSIVELYNCVARKATAANFKIVTSGAIMNASNCRSTLLAGAVERSIAAGGVLNVISDPALV